MPRLDTELMDARKTKFLEQYALTGVIQPACDVADISRSTYKDWRHKDPDFDAACDDAFQAAVDDAEGVLRRRGVEGIEEVVLYKGEPIWRRDPATLELLLDDEFNPVPFTRLVHNDKLLETYVKAHRPVYREKSGLELTGKDGASLPPVTVTYVLPPGKTVEDYDQAGGDDGDSEGGDQA